MQQQNELLLSVTQQKLVVLNRCYEHLRIIEVSVIIVDSAGREKFCPCRLFFRMKDIIDTYWELIE